MANMDKIQEAIINGDITQVKSLVKTAIEQKASVKDILENGLIAGMNVVGRKFKANEIFIPEVLISAKAMQQGVSILEPLLIGAGCKPKARVVIGTVKGDLHDIGKNLVAMMLKGAGFEIIDLGIDVSVKKFVDAIKQHSPQILAMSSLLTTSMPAMAEVVKSLKQEKLFVKTMIGGAPLTQEFADKIGANGYAPDAASAVDLAKDFLGV